MPIPITQTIKTPATIFQSRSKRIKKEALALGFVSVGIAPVSALENSREKFQNWLSLGRHGTMQYLEDFFQRHVQFREQVEPLRNFIVVAAAYDSQMSRPLPPSTGRIARYAWGRDYHRVLQKRLKSLEKIVQSLDDASIQTRCCVDTAPIHERSLAHAAGIGFIGKNTCLIVPKGGSWIVLGIIATSLELESDLPVLNSCGDCTRCLEACPTGALTEAYQMDATQCISYLTLEHRGDLPGKLQGKMQNWIAGCDICQEVCPYNAKPFREPCQELKAKAGNGQGIPLQELLAIKDEKTFTKRFAGTALMRPKYQGLLRNAAIAAGNSADASLKPALEDRKNDPNPVIRDAVGWALEQLERKTG